MALTRVGAAKLRLRSAGAIVDSSDHSKADQVYMLAAQTEALIGIGHALLEVVGELRAIRKAVAEG